MKKFLAIIAVAGTLVACNSGSETTTTTNVDSLRVADSTRMADSLRMVDTTHKMTTTDTTIKTTTTTDTTVKK
jgi:hypothetical protein